MLLCCELERCQAAFLAGKNCYSVTCFTTNHCATAPALNNKWQPVVAFVKRFNRVVHVQPGELSLFSNAKMAVILVSIRVWTNIVQLQ